jgi:hypothetical protein
MDLKAIFDTILQLVPTEVAKGVQAMEAETLSNDDKRTKVIEDTTIALGTVSDLATHELANHPDFKAKLGELVDVLVSVGRTAQQLATAAGGSSQS